MKNSKKLRKSIKKPTQQLSPSFHSNFAYYFWSNMMSRLLVTLLFCVVAVFGDENCYDYRSCYQQNMTDGKITCTGNQGCRGATIDTESDVYCYGYYGMSICYIYFTCY